MNRPGRGSPAQKGVAGANKHGGANGRAVSRYWTVLRTLLILTMLFGSLALPHYAQAQTQGGAASAAEDDEAAGDDADKLFEQVFGKRQSGGQPALEVPLVVDGVDRGSINIETADDPFETKMDREAFLDQVVDFLNEEGADLLLAIPEEDGKITAGQLFEFGIMAEFNSADLVMQIDIDPELRRPLPLNLTNRGRPPRSLTEPLGPAPISGYVNIRTGLDHIHETTGDSDTGTNPVRVDFAGALALPEAALDYRFSYNENSTRPWRRGDIRVLRDIPDSALRWTYGDLSFPTTNFQSFTAMGGVTVARNYALQPYVVTEPIASNQFVLRSASQVEVLINGAVVRTFRLPAGRYDLRDLPLGSGVNDVVLRITNDVGEVEETTFSLFFDSELLAPGIDQFSASLGLPAEEKDGIRTYDTSTTTFSGNYRRGITNTLTLGADLQGNNIQQLLGAQALWAARFGTVEGRIAGSYIEGSNADLSARLGYRIRGIRGTANRNFDLSLLYTGQRFGALGSTQPNNNSALDAAVRYSQRLPMKLSGSLGGTFKLARNDARNSGSVSGSLSRQLARGANLSLDLQRRRDNEGAYENRAFVSLNISLPGAGQNLTATRDSQTGVSRLDWNYRPESVIGGVAATAGIQRDSGDTRFSGELSRTGYRAEASISHDASLPRSDLTESERVTSVRLGTAVVFAGGHVAVSRPITDGFAIVVPHPSLKGQTVGINPRGEGAYVAEADAFGPAVIPDLTSYQVRRILVDVPDLAIGAELGQDVFDVVPTVRSGTTINIGTAASVLATFKVVDDAGEPIALQAGEIRQIDSESFEPLLVFSDRNGLMTSDGLTAGTYELTLFAFPDLPVTFEVADDAIGIVDLGTFRISLTGQSVVPSDTGPSDIPETKPEADDLAPVREAEADDAVAEPAEEGDEIEVARRPDASTDTETADVQATEPVPTDEAPATTDEAGTAIPAPEVPPTAATRGTALPRELASNPQNFGQYRVQLAAFRAPREAEVAWSAVQTRHPDVLGALDAVVVEVDLERRGVFYRLQVGPLPDQISARQLCRTLQERGQSCLVVSPAGAPPAQQPPRPGQERASLTTDQPSNDGPVVPAVPVAPVEAAPATVTTEPAQTATPPTAHLIQLASLQTAAAAQAEWQRLKTRHPTLLGALDLVVVPVDLGASRGIFHRLQAGPLADAGAARSVCTALRQEGQACLEVAPDTEAVEQTRPQQPRVSDVPETTSSPPALRSEDRVLPPTTTQSRIGSQASLNLENGQPDGTLVISSQGATVQTAERSGNDTPGQGQTAAADGDTTASRPTTYRLRLATARFEGDANAALRRLKQDLGNALTRLESQVVPVRENSNAATNYQVEAGAFNDRNDALAACRPIQSAGQPCLVVEARANNRPPEGTGPLSLLRSTQ